MSYDKFIDPNFLSKMTYRDSNGIRRVKNPYRNRKSYEMFTNRVSGNDFTFIIPEDITGKSVYVDFPAKPNYQFIVSAASNSVTVLNVPHEIYIIVNVVNPRPLPPSDSDLKWDELAYDAQKAIVAAWGDIELVCNVLYPSTADSELGYDDQNTLKYGLVGWRNNCGNDKGTMWGRPSAHNNGYRLHVDPPTPPPQTPDKDPDINHGYDYKFVLKWEDSTQTDLDLRAYLDHSKNKGVYYDYRHYSNGTDNLWLDFDHTSHTEGGRDSQPEVVTVLGFKGSTLSIQVENFNRRSLNEDVTLDIYDKSVKLVKSFTIPYTTLSQSKKGFWICDVDLSSGTIIDKMKNVSVVGRFD